MSFKDFFTLDIDNNLSSISAKQILISIISLAAVIRLWGIWHGYPYSYFPDEAHFVKRALSFGSLDFNPHWFHKPAFYMYLLFFEYGLYFIFGKIIGLWTSVSEFAVAYIINPGPLYIIGRVTTALFGLGTIWIVYIIGERFFRKNAGLFGALLLSLSYAHIVACQDIKADVPTTFFAILSMYYLLRYEAETRIRFLIFSACVAGIGAATKYYPIVMLLPLFTVIILIAWEEKRKLTTRVSYIATWCGVAFAFHWGTYFICSPYNFIDPLGRRWTFGPILKLFLKISHIFAKQPSAAVTELGLSEVVIQKPGIGDSFISYFQVLIHESGIGIVIACITFAGVGYLLWKFSRRIFIFLLFPAGFVLLSVYTHPGYAAARHQLPVYPFLAIAGGYFMVWLTENSNSAIKRAVAIMVFISLCFPLYNIVNRGIFIAKTDTRNLAKRWIESNIPAGTKIIMNENGPFLLLSKERISDHMATVAKFDSNGQFTASYDTYLNYQLQAEKSYVTYNYYEIRIPWWRKSFTKTGAHELSSNYDKDFGNPVKKVGVDSYDDYVKNNFDYAIVHSYSYANFFIDNSKPAKNFPAFAKFYEELFKKGTLVKEFSNKADPRPGPTVKIFKINNS